MPVLFPALVASVRLGVRKQAVLIAATIMTGASVLISGFSIGLFYLPAGIAMLIVACVEDSAKGVKHTPLLTGRKHEATGLKNFIFPGANGEARAHTMAEAQPLSQLTTMLGNAIHRPVVIRRG